MGTPLSGAKSKWHVGTRESPVLVPRDGEADIMYFGAGEFEDV